MKNFLLALTVLAGTFPALAQRPVPLAAQIKAIPSAAAGQSSGTVLVVAFTWTNPTVTTCPVSSPSSCATNYTLVDTTGLAVGAALPTTPCTTTLQTSCVAATGIALTADSYQYTPLVAISSTVSYSHDFVLVTNGYNSSGVAATADSATALVTYVPPFTLPAVTNFQGVIP